MRRGKSFDAFRYLLDSVLMQHNRPALAPGIDVERDSGGHDFKVPLGSSVRIDPQRLLPG